MRIALIQRSWWEETRSGRISMFLGFVLIFSLLLVVLGERMTESVTFAASVAVMFSAIVLMLIDFRLSLLLFVGFLFAYEEFNIASEQAFVEENIANTVMAVKIFGIALMDMLSLVFLVPVLLREWRRAVVTGHWRWMKTDAYLLPLAVVLLYGIVPGLLNMNSVSDFTWDLRMLLHVLVFYFIFSRSFTSRSDYLLALLVGGGVFMLKHGVFFYRYLTGGGLQTGMYNRVLLGSDLPLTALALALTVAALFVYRARWKISPNADSQNANPAWRARALHWTLLLLAGYFTVMLIAGLGKLTYLQAAYSLLLVFLLHRKDVHLRTVLAVIAFGAAGSVLVFFTVLPVDGRTAITYALSSAFNWWDALKLYGDLSFGTRLLEVINVWAMLVRDNAVLWGLGWGAAWREIAMHMPFDGGSFAVTEQYTGVHIQTHIDAITFMLKVGIIGTLAIYGSLFRFWLAGIRMYRRQGSAWEKWVLMALILMIAIFAPNYLYFIRLKYLLGFALAGIAIFAGSDDSRETAHTGIADSDHAE